MIRALEKAQELEQLRAHDGAAHEGLELCLTDREAFELIDWYLTQDLGENFDLEQLARDVAEARSRRDPSHVLQHFCVQGFKIARQRVILLR